MRRTRRIASNLLFDGERISAHPLVELDATSGEILSVSSFQDDIDRQEGVEFHAGIMCPALINCHCHTELSHLRGKIAPGGGMSSFASEVAKYRDAEQSLRRDAAREACDEMYRNGISAVGDISNDGIAVESGQLKVRTFLEVFGLRRSNLEIQSERMAENGTCSLTPHSMYSITDEDLRKVTYEGDAPLSIHFMETEEERLLFEGKGPMAEWFVRQKFDAAFLRKYSSPAERLVRTTPRDRDVILVHSVFASERDIDMVMNHFTGTVHWVLCPRSNRYISGSDISSSAVASTAGLDICLGTDSLASNTSLSILEEIKSIEDCNIPRWLQAATSAGARALRMEDRFGHIRRGMSPGIIVIGGVNSDLHGFNAGASAERI